MSSNSRSKTGNITGLKSGDCLVTDHAEISEIINKHFSDVGMKLSSSLPEATKSYLGYFSSTESRFEIAEIDPNTV